MPDALPRPDSHAIAVAKLQEALHRAVDALEPELRSAFLLHDMEKLSNEEAARRLELSPATVRARLQRARKEICRLLWQQFGEEEQKPDATQDRGWKVPSGEAPHSSKIRRAPGTAA